MSLKNTKNKRGSVTDRSKKTRFAKKNYTISVDIVLPIYNSLHHVRPCLESIFHHSGDTFHLYVIDDGSDAYTKEVTHRILSGYDQTNYSYYENENNMGYLKTANQGARTGSSPFVVFINSDVIVTPGWLNKLISRFNDPEVAVVNPVSNWANWTRIEFLSGFTINEYAKFIEEVGAGPPVDIYNASGFCFAVRRDTFEKLGYFDEYFNPGYWEETDFCMKVLENSQRVVVDLSVFLYHFGWGSFNTSGRNENMERNRKSFIERWEQEFEHYRLRWLGEKPLQPLNNAIERSKKQDGIYYDNMELLQEKLYRWLKTFGPRVTAKVAIGCAMNAILKTSFETSPYKIKYRNEIDKANSVPDSFRGPPQWTRLFHAPLDSLKREFPVEETSVLKANHKMSPPRILYILPGVVLFGGIISVVQVVNSLIRRGISANIVTFGPIDESMQRFYPMYFRPYVFKNRAAMMRNFPDCDIVVATRWDTVYDALAIRERRPDLPFVYFVQGFEPDIYEDYPKLAELAEKTYFLTPFKICKTEWLRNILLNYAGQVEKITLGLNLDIFYDREKRFRTPTITAMARPSSKYRNFGGTLRAFDILAKRRSDLRFVLYGATLDKFKLPDYIENRGPLYNPVDVAKLYNETKIFVDCSFVQGFGRPGLEAMACGAATVLTCHGGITEYAKHEYNTLLIRPRNPVEIADAVERLVDDPRMRTRLIENGKKTVLDYDMELEGERTYKYIRSLVNNAP